MKMRNLYEIILDKPIEGSSFQKKMVYSISKWAFRGICLLILLLPVSRHWQLLITGGRANGTVTEYTVRIVEDIMKERDLEQASEIEFEVDGVIYKTYGPRNYEYEVGRSVTVFYMQKDPSHNCVATFSGFYLSYYTVLPIILLTVWYAFYLSFNNYRRRMKRPKGHPVKRPTKRPLRSRIHPSFLSKD